MIDRMARRYGAPCVKTFKIDASSKELRRIRSSQKHGRNHDVTLYVRKEGRIVVIAKHMYPPGLYRAPSGGLAPGEDFHAGIRREMAEEIGCEITLRTFLLRTGVLFRCGSDEVYWRSFVFLADYLRGDFHFTDRDEIRGVHFAAWEDFRDYGRIMRRTDIGGLHYRAALHEKVSQLARTRRD
jgi:8-oxo-dGTP pyrophosphatase MutT (NUDIX family)